MKQTFLTLFLMAFTQSFSQINPLSEKILNDILTTRAGQYGTIEILAKPAPQLIEKHLVKLIQTKDRIFNSTEENKTETIQLTEKERDFILTSIRQQYKKEWKKDDFKNYPLSDNINKQGYLVREDRNRTLILLSRPILIRNNKIAVVYFGQFIHQLEFAHTDISFYRIENGIWKKHICISSATGKRKN